MIRPCCVTFDSISASSPRSYTPSITSFFNKAKISSTTNNHIKSDKKQHYHLQHAQPSHTNSNHSTDNNTDRAFIRDTGHTNIIDDDDDDDIVDLTDIQDIHIQTDPTISIQSSYIETCHPVSCPPTDVDESVNEHKESTHEIVNSTEDEIIVYDLVDDASNLSYHPIQHASWKQSEP